MSEPRFVEATPISGYLTHAVRNQPAFFHQSMPGVVITYHRAICGVGRGGMRVRLDEDHNPRPWLGFDGCNTCHTRLAKLDLDIIKAGAYIAAKETK